MLQATTTENIQVKYTFGLNLEQPTVQDIHGNDTETKTSADSHSYLHTYELLFLGYVYKWAITGKVNSYVASHLLNVTTSVQIKLGVISGMLLTRIIINIKSRYKNETFVASHGVFHMVQATNKTYTIYSRNWGTENIIL
jgi:hypothetical protein